MSWNVQCQMKTDGPTSNEASCSCRPAASDKWLPSQRQCPSEDRDARDSRSLVVNDVDVRRSSSGGGRMVAHMSGQFITYSWWSGQWIRGAGDVGVYVLTECSIASGTEVREVYLCGRTYRLVSQTPGSHGRHLVERDGESVASRSGACKPATDAKIYRRADALCGRSTRWIRV